MNKIKAFSCIFIFFLISCSHYQLANEQQNIDVVSVSNQETFKEIKEETLQKDIDITISFAGDCTLGSDIKANNKSSFNTKFKRVNDPSYFFKNVVDIFNKDDATIVNLEGTFTTSNIRQKKQFAFKGDPKYVEILTAGNVQAVSLANNHSMDYGYNSYLETIKTLENTGIKTFGYERISYLIIKDIKIALIGAYAQSNYKYGTSQMLNNIKVAQNANADIIIVFAHWGIEKETIANINQIKMAHAAIDAGADLVIGSHPHVIQGHEIYKQHHIVYSLGNFCFGGNSNPRDKDCMIVQTQFKIDADTKNISNIDLNIIPCLISSTNSYNNYQPTLAKDEDLIRINNKIETSSKEILNIVKQYFNE